MVPVHLVRVHFPHTVSSKVAGDEGFLLALMLSNFFLCLTLTSLWGHASWAKIIDIKSLQNRLLKVHYVPATSASFNKILFFLFFAAAINSTNESSKASSTCP
jgi:hypothetical protein